MAGKQAKILSEAQMRAALSAVARHRYAARDRVMLFLSFHAGMRAGEIAKLTWPMITTATGRLARVIELHDRAAKKGSGRAIPMHPALRQALIAWRRQAPAGPAVIASERGAPMRASSVVNWFASLYRSLGFSGCSSHSGRRTFVTKAARLVSRAGGSLRDVQQLAGHRSIEQTQAYIDGDSGAKHRLIGLL